MWKGIVRSTAAPSRLLARVRGPALRLAAATLLADHAIVRARRGPPPRLIAVPPAERASADRAAASPPHVRSPPQSSDRRRPGSMPPGVIARSSIARPSDLRRAFARGPPRSAPSPILHPTPARDRRLSPSAPTAAHPSPPAATPEFSPRAPPLRAPPIPRLIHITMRRMRLPRRFSAVERPADFCTMAATFPHFWPGYPRCQANSRRDTRPAPPQYTSGFSPSSAPDSTFPHALWITPPLVDNWLCTFIRSCTKIRAAAQNTAVARSLENFDVEQVKNG